MADISADLVKTLEHPNGWHRDAAHRLLLERLDKTAPPLLTDLALKTKAIRDLQTKKDDR